MGAAFVPSLTTDLADVVAAEQAVINLERMYLGLTRIEAEPKRKGGRRC
jgi:hypothetical protein